MATVKTSFIVYRFLFFTLMIIQCVFIASYPAHYEDKDGWYAVTILFIPAVLIWWYFYSTNANRTSLAEGGLFWLVYVWLGIVPMIGIVFGRTGDEIVSKGFWNASTLIMTLCLSPLLLLIIHDETATNYGEDHARRIRELTAITVINLFDGIELLGVILDENECSHGIPKDFKNALIAFTCIRFLWLPLPLVALGMALDSEGHEDPFELDNVCFRLFYAIETLFDTIFLGLRLGLCLGYGKSASIFINKNIIIIIVLMRRILSPFCGSDDPASSNSTPNQRQGGSSEPSTATRPAPAPTPYPENQQQSGSIEPSTSATPRSTVLENTPTVINVHGFNSGLETSHPSDPPPPYTEY